MKPTYWTLERCKEEALKYSTRAQWKVASKSSYCAAKLKSALDECCRHMKEVVKPRGYWNEDRCKEIVAGYQHRTQWAKGHPSSYSSARFLQILDECCTHMTYSNERWRK